MTLSDDGIFWLLTVLASDPYYAEAVLNDSDADARRDMIGLIESFMCMYDKIQYVAGDPDCERIRNEVRELEELMQWITALSETYAQDVAAATLEVALDFAAKAYGTPQTGVIA